MSNPDFIKNRLIRISKGDTHAFREFYNHFFKKVIQFAHYYIKSEEICEEIVSDVFISIWLNKEKLSEVENIEAYLFVITKNKSFHYLEKEFRIPRQSLDMVLEIKSEQQDPEHILLTRELEVVIQESIEQLPERCRIIFQMSREEKLKHHQIAQILSISEHTVHAQMVIALQKLHLLLKKYLYLFI